MSAASDGISREDQSETKSDNAGGATGGAASDQSQADNASSDAAAGNTGQDNVSSGAGLADSRPTPETIYSAAVTKQFSKDSKQNRKHRGYLFFSFICVSIGICVSVLHIAYTIVSKIDINRVFDPSAKVNWLLLIPLDVIILTMCGMFLTIFVTLVRFVETGRPRESVKGNAAPITASKPAADVVKSFTELLSAFAGLAKSIKECIKSAKP
ncbi:hypothetical protein [Acetobacter cerevisiae]|uniref:hypothetical protein n=1 Tax=Acetobacter cerevisiae TaxID=178900 RepID=UPI0020A1B8F6|nr:hypothetical protein [Acetobacter cerevisiae]MCP1269458.1 hypothetical protein [Acetobacter cerevisiae]MCP1277412.1 hypothetical protein [Acetobacter cerevisiae]